jgi:hypothetical protein
MLAPAAPIANGKYAILSALNGKGMAVSGGSTASSAKVIMWAYTPDNGNANDQWNITKIGTTGYYRITNVKSGLDLNVQGATYNKTADLIQFAYNSAAPNNDEWKITDVGGGQYKIESRYSSQCVNVEAAATVDGTQVVQYPYSNVAHSKWTFQAIP